MIYFVWVMAIKAQYLPFIIDREHSTSMLKVCVWTWDNGIDEISHSVVGLPDEHPPSRQIHICSPMAAISDYNPGIVDCAGPRIAVALQQPYIMHNAGMPDERGYRPVGVDALANNITMVVDGICTADAPTGICSKVIHLALLPKDSVGFVGDRDRKTNYLSSVVYAVGAGAGIARWHRKRQELAVVP